MTDVHTKEQRSRNMAAIKSKNTKAELLVRSFLHKNGFRFRLKAKYLPCNPDIILPKYSTVIFVHGCYWHRHGCKNTTTPKTNTEFWLKKFNDNVKRDKNNQKVLEDFGWNVVTIWECKITESNLKKLLNLII
tara:strand:- start:15 stop:413 length:399 start_codon:yes stop_codon:yes gene_type:complete